MKILVTGGATDYIVEGINGLFFGQQTVSALSDTIKKFEQNKFDSSKVAKSITKFSVQEFKKNMLDLVNKKLEDNI